jgi:SnoaL-like domain
MTADTQADTGHAETITRFFDAIAAGDSATLLEILTPDAITRWPQSGERITGAMSCVRIYENYPGGPPRFRFERITGAGDTWTAEMVLSYGEEPWYGVSIVEFEGQRIARMTDYFGPAFPAPAWRAQWVEREDATH